MANPRREQRQQAALKQREQSRRLSQRGYGVTVKAMADVRPLDRRKGDQAMEPIEFNLCPECDQCPEVVIEAGGVKIGEADNIVRLSYPEWNQLVALIREGRLGKVE
jgi:hypothetical protein